MQFREVIGNREIKEWLIRSSVEKKISHALLFLGAEGSGNLAMALAFAQYLCCENKNNDDACGECSGCSKANKLVHPDVTFTYPVAPKDKIQKPKSADFLKEWRAAVQGNPYMNFNDWVDALEIENKQGIISTEESSDLIRRIGLKNVESEYKIVIVWLPEKMNASAANKLLKTLEEPPDSTLFFLVSENHELLLPTILSRTQLVKINSVDDETLVKELLRAGTLTPEQIRKIVYRAAGNIRDALQLAGQHTSEEDSLNLDFLQWMRSCFTLELTQIAGLNEQLAEAGREKQKLFFLNSLSILRECMLIRKSVDPLIRFDGEELDRFSRFAKYVHDENINLLVNELSEAIRHIERNANFKILFTDLSFSVARLLKIKPATPA